MRRTLSFISAVIMLFALITGCNINNTHQINICLGEKVTLLDPISVGQNNASSMLLHIYEGLFRFNEQGHAEKALAAEYEVNADGSQYTFHLKEGIEYSDGTALRADDFVFAWKRAADPKNGSEVSHLFEIFDGYDKGDINVTAIDDRTLQVQLNGPHTYFTKLLALPAFVPLREDIILKDEAGWASKASMIIGNGAFKISKWNDTLLILTKNSRYHDKDLVMANELQFRFLDGANKSASFLNGGISFAYQLKEPQISSWTEDTQYKQIPELGTYFLEFNTDSSAVSNIDLRHALTLAVPRAEIIKGLISGGMPANTLLPPYINGFSKSEDLDIDTQFFDLEDQAKNIEYAKELIDNSGINFNKKSAEITFLYYNHGIHTEIAKILKAAWEELGIKVNLETHDSWNNFLNARARGDYDITHFGWFAEYDDPVSFLKLFHSKSDQNDARWQSSKYDELFSEIQQQNDPDQRDLLIAEAQSLIFEKWICCPIFYSYASYLQSSSLKDVITSPLGFVLFTRAYTEKS